MQIPSSSMTLLEQAGVALAVRPMLWFQLDSHVAAILRSRLTGSAYTAIADMLGPTQGWTPRMVKDYEQAGCRMVLKKQRLATQLDRLGYGKRWRLYGIPE